MSRISHDVNVPPNVYFVNTAETMNNERLNISQIPIFDKQRV